jgi:hypothetical protein
VILHVVEELFDGGDPDLSLFRQVLVQKPTLPRGDFVAGELVRGFVKGSHVLKEGPGGLRRQP